MQFTEQLDVLEEIFEHHKVDNRDIQDYRQTVNECIARQVNTALIEAYGTYVRNLRRKCRLKTPTNTAIF